MTDLQPTERTRVRRVPARAVYDRAVIEAILDAGPVAHLGFAVDGQPYVIPTLHARVGDLIYLHGSAASRMARMAAAGEPVCLTVTHLDGLVLARSAFHHSMNYRSAVVLGVARAVEDPDAKLAALEAFAEGLIPGRWAEVRPPSRQELKGTAVLALDLREASAKVRTGGPVDDEEDYALDVWAGVVPLSLEPRDVIEDERLRPGVPRSAALEAWLAARGERLAAN